jgi:HD-GYP domain-containing protein (c-di-GMP phosphodiesterase class II)
MIAGHAASARGLAVDLGLPDGVQQAVGASYEMWDGKGWPGALKGDDIPLAARIGLMAELLEVAHRLGGVDAALRLAGRQSGRQFDPGLCVLVADDAERVFGRVDDARTWDVVIDSEPALGVRLDDEQFDRALRAVAEFVDLKTPYLLGHAGAVADLVAGAGAALSLPAADQLTLTRAGLAHGLGRLGISNAIWDKAGPLGRGEQERVRLQPYLTDRMLQQSRCLAPVGAVAVQLRERLDGSGYPRALSGGALSPPARVLAAADVYQSMCEPRPHRPARPPTEAAAELRAEVRAGRLDGDAVEAVLQAAGHRARRRPEGPAGLTAREVDVLRLLARGLSSKDIARELVISPKTARNHLEHIYVKIGATSRVTASLFAVQHGLLPADQLDG